MYELDIELVLLGFGGQKEQGMDIKQMETSDSHMLLGRFTGLLCFSSRFIIY